MDSLRKQTLHDAPALQGKRVLLRVDFNVPLQDGQVLDDTRIRLSLPTIRALLERRCALVIVSHLGRPKGKIVEALRLDPVARRLEELLGVAVQKCDQVCGPEVQQAASALQPGQVLMLENVRFDPREEANDPSLAEELATLADVYVNDAFGVAHRAHASTAGVAAYLPAYAGELLAKELEALRSLLEAPARPFWAVIGGAKVADKLGVLRRLLDRCDGIAIGGGMANTFLKAKGYEVGRSLVEPDQLDEAAGILAEAERRGVPFLLPLDVVAADRFAADATATVVPVDAIPAEQMVLDIGPETVAAYARRLEEAATIYWNGPLGVYEWPAFAEGTIAIARTLAATNAWTVVGGGDSLAALRLAGVYDRIGHVSTGGGASLELLEGKTLPGVAALLDRPSSPEQARRTGNER